MRTVMGRPRMVPHYDAIPFASYEHVSDFLRDAETACILDGQPSDGTVHFDSVARSLHQLGRPDRAYRSIHITGTNGKTTVSRMLAALLRNAGLKVGLYTSPHIGPPHHSIAIDGRPISEQHFVDACNHIRPYLDWDGVRISPFEFLTVAAFFAFRAARVDYAVIEVGIGGRRDATNILAPDVAVITNIAEDHLSLLGGSLTAVAREKAGIIKPFTPLVCGVSGNTPRAIVLEEAARLHAPVRLIGHDYEVGSVQMDRGTTRGSIRIGDTFWDNLTLPAPATFMLANAAHALTAFDLLQQRSLVNTVPPDRVRQLFASMDLADCSETFEGPPPVLLNGAHNAPAAAALAATLRHVWETHDPLFVIAVHRDKDADTMLRHLAATRPGRAIFTRCPSGLHFEPEALAVRWQTLTAAPAEVVPDPTAAIRRAVAVADRTAVVVVTGSLQLAALGRATLLTPVPSSPSRS